VWSHVLKGCRANARLIVVTFIGRAFTGQYNGGSGQVPNKSRFVSPGAMREDIVC
jgi:hypothetical protein